MGEQLSRSDLVVRRDGVSLAGSVWRSDRAPRATVLMHPGSGPSDRHNDVYFAPIRAGLLESGIAVASFDKRGVGQSTGRWEDAAIVEQADDALACVAALESELPDTPIGLFGHSQGGWVVLEATSRSPEIAFVVTNAGPGVTPGEQERWAMQTHLTRAGISRDELAEAERYVDRLFSMMRERVPFAQVRADVDSEGSPSAFGRLGLPALPADEAQWNLMAAMLDYDPQPALARIRVPLLAMFGANDLITPVEASVAVYREAVRSDLLRLAVFEGANHRVQCGDPPQLAEGYDETLVGFVVEAVT